MQKIGDYEFLITLYHSKTSRRPHRLFLCRSQH